jgi:hypothetical protein
MAAGTPTFSIPGTTGGGGAPDNAKYLVLALDASLTQERVFTPSDGLVAVDGGANSTYILAVSDLYHPFLTMGG